MSLRNITLTITFFMLISCSKHEVEVQPLTAHDIELKSLPLTQIKGYLFGKWKLIYAFGGITGNTQINYPDSYINFSTGDFITWTANAMFVAQSPISWLSAKDIYGVNTSLMQFKNIYSEPYTWGAEQIRHDTLILYANNYDGYKYFLVKSQ